MIRATALAIGVCVAALYTLSPLTVCVIAACAVALPRFAKGLAGDQRRWLTAIVLAAALARVVAIGGTLVRHAPIHDDQFVGAASGDEAYVMSRALRVRDIVTGGAAGNYDYFVAYDDYGRNSYVTIVSALQVIFGPTPYALRLLNAAAFLAGALLLFGLCRTSFGSLPAVIGVTVLLFWPTLFVWSISLLKEPLYFLCGALILSGVVRALRDPGLRARAGAVLVVTAAATLVKDLRPGALPLAAAGIALGITATLVLASSRRFVGAALAGLVMIAAAVQVPAISTRLVAGLEAAAKTHSGHVFTVGHAYKLLDDGFYVNPAPAAASHLTLTGGEAGRFLVRAAASFVLVPVPWQLQSARELAYVPEQLAWYGLVLLLPLGALRAYRRDPLVTCLLLGMVVPTAAALALTNGNVGTLLRLRGLVIPYLVWIGAIGFCALLDAPGRNPEMPIVDNTPPRAGRFNLFDAAIAAAVLVCMPIAYGTYWLFRPPVPRIIAVERVPITAEERRVAGGNRLTAKLKVRGAGLRPLLRAALDGTPAIGFVFEDPNTADVLVGTVAPGAHDLVLFDGVQEVARMPKAIVIGAVDSARVLADGMFIGMEEAAAAALTVGGNVLKLGAPQHGTGGWQRAAELELPCDPESQDTGCAVGGVPLMAPLPTLRVDTPSGSRAFAVRDLFPWTPPAMRTAIVRVSSAPEVVDLIRTGDRDDALDDRAATVVAVGGRKTGGRLSEADVTLRLGVDDAPDGARYRGRRLKAGSPLTLSMPRYVVEGIVLSIGGAPLGDRR